MDSETQQGAGHETGEDDGARTGALPREFDGYRLMGQLGSGGQGVVYEAEELATGRRVAIKMLRSGVLAGELELERFNREARLAASLAHENLVRVFGSGQVGEIPYLVLELVRGVPLLEHADAKGLSVRERVELIVQACAGIAEAHRRGIIHRDLKADNVLVDALGRPRILDFGTARLLDEAGLTQGEQFVGTYRDASPEQVTGHPVDTRADVHALGLLLYQFLAGRHPVPVGASMAEMTRLIAAEDPAPPSTSNPEIDPDLDAICACALAKDPDERYESVADFARDLENWLRARPVSARRGGRLYVAKKLLLRHPRQSALAGLGLFAILVLSVTSALLAARATDERDRARTEAAKAEELLVEAMGLLSLPGELDGDADSRGPYRRISAAYNVFSGKSPTDSEARARLQASLAEVTLAAGEPEWAAELFSTSLESRRLAGVTDPEILAPLLVGMSRVQVRMGKKDTARESAADAEAMLVASGATQGSTLAEARLILAKLAVEQGRVIRAGRLESMVAAQWDGLALDAPESFRLWRLRASVLEGVGRSREALDLIEDFLSRRPITEDVTDPSAIELRVRRADLLLADGRSREALPELRWALARQVSAYGEDSPELVPAALLAAVACAQSDRHEEGAAYVSDALRIKDLVHRGRYPERAVLLRCLAEFRSRAGAPTGQVVDLRERAERSDEAEAALRVSGIRPEPTGELLALAGSLGLPVAS